MINKRFPGHSIVGEETDSTLGTDSFLWLLDPIDGTDDLIRGIPLYGSVIAVLYRGQPVVGIIDHPELNIRCQAAYALGTYINGMKFEFDSMVSSNISEAVVFPAYEDFQNLENCNETFVALASEFPNQRVYRNVYGHTMIASGNCTAGLEIGVAPWDLAATQLIIEEVNEKFVYFRDCGSDYQNRRLSAVFGRASLVDKILSIIEKPV